MNMRIEDPSFDVAYSYDGTIEGLFSAIFAAYANHENPIDIAPQSRLQLRLGQQERYIETNFTRANRVANGIARAGGRSTFNAIRKASVSSNAHTGTIIFHFVQKLMKERRYLLNQLSDPLVADLFELVRSVDNECEKMRQFIRFAHLENGGWLAVCNPRDNVIPLLMNWFAARFNDQSFAIYDEVHHIAGVYEGKNWYLVRTNCFQEPEYSSEESLMQDAWRTFYRTLSVDARYNPELRRQHMPVRFWRNLTEMQQPDAFLGARKTKLEARLSQQLNEATEGKGAKKVLASGGGTTASTFKADDSTLPVSPQQPK